MSWSRFFGKKKKNEESRINEEETLKRNVIGERQEWYSRHSKYIPAGCRACGGNYPECKYSCPLYDD